MAGKELKKLIKELERQGWRVEHRKGGHYMAWPPEKSAQPVVMAASGSDHRGWKNMVSELRRSGAEL